MSAGSGLGLSGGIPDPDEDGVAGMLDQIPILVSRRERSSIVNFCYQPRRSKGTRGNHRTACGRPPRFSIFRER